MQLRLGSFVVIVLGGAVIGACSGGGDRPAPSQDIGVAPPLPPPPPSTTQSDDGPCDALTLRKCTHNWVDASGQHHCNSSFQFCKKDGTSWLPCADYLTGPTGDPQYPE